MNVLSRCQRSWRRTRYDLTRFAIRCVITERFRLIYHGGGWHTPILVRSICISLAVANNAVLENGSNHWTILTVPAIPVRCGRHVCNGDDKDERKRSKGIDHGTRVYQVLEIRTIWVMYNELRDIVQVSTESLRLEKWIAGYRHLCKPETSHLIWESRWQMWKAEHRRRRSPRRLNPLMNLHDPLY